MRVVSLVNGSLISKTSSMYALQYAKQLGYELNLVYIQGEEAFNEVEKSMQEIFEFSNKLNLNSSFKVFDSLKSFKKFVDDKNVDTVFTSTRQERNYFKSSFTKLLIKENLKSDLAIVKVVKVGRAENVEHIILPIRDIRLSVKKFTFFTSMVLAYNSKSEVYSLDNISKAKLSELTPEKIKNRLKEISFNLKHYLKLSTMLNFKFALKHDFTRKEESKVQTHIVKHNFDLAIVGAHHDKSFFDNHPIDILFEEPIINTIYYLPHKGDL